MAEPMLSQDKPSLHGPAFSPDFVAQAPGSGNEDYLHELRVRIPVDLHRQLLSLKVLRGKSLAETVSTALDIYFAEHTKRTEESE
jgi:hypothetical protein